MIDKFLSAKHWQLFILLFGIPFILQIVMTQRMFSTFNNIQTTGNLVEPDFGNLFIITFVVSALYMAIFYGWMWSIGVGLQSKISKHFKMKVGRFKAFLLFPVVYIALIILCMTFLFSNLENFNPSLIAVILPLHFFAIFCMFYCLYFIAKTIKTAEEQKELRFSDFAGEFFLMWFYPIGIWFLQPRINKIHASELDEGIEQHLVV